MANCHFRGTPLEPGLPEFALQVPQGTSSGSLAKLGFTAAEEEDLTFKTDEDERATFAEDDEAGIGVMAGRLELLLRIGVIAGRLELDDM